MKVFISWSGESSKQIALILKDWFPNVIQSLEPWMSEKDIEKGARWSEEIAKELNQSDVGLICVTKDNYGAPWLNFEAGAISKIVKDKTRVCPYLFDITKADMEGPLTQFQMTTSDKDDTHQLLCALNNALEKNKLSEKRVNEAFDRWWPDLQKKLDEIPTRTAIKAPVREEREILEEILEIVRQLNRVSTDQLLELADHLNKVRNRPYDWLRNILYNAALFPRPSTGETDSVETDKGEQSNAEKEGGAKENLENE